MKKIYLLWSILLLCFSHGIAQVSFQTKVSKNRLGLNERLRVSFEMNQNGQRLSIEIQLIFAHHHHFEYRVERNLKMEIQTINQ